MTAFGRALLVLLAACTFAACGTAKTVTAPLRLHPELAAQDGGASGCGVERAAVKHLTDSVPLAPGVQIDTIDQLVAMTPPIVTADSPRFAVEKQIVELRNVHVIAAKQEADSDLHVIVATPTGAELNVESPQARCDSTSPYAAQLAQARQELDAVLGHVSSTGYTPEDLTANIQGVLFFDVLHGQRGAPNGVELHPVLCFSTNGGCDTTPPAPPATTPVTMPATTTSPPAPPPAASDDAADELPGCVRYPDRIYWHHVKQSHCAATFFTSP